MMPNYEIHIEHKIFLKDDQSSVNWLEDFLKSNDFSKLWIKVFVMDKHYANLLKNSSSREAVRVLQDNTKTKYNNLTPYEQLLQKCSCTLESFEKKFFLMRGGTLHNKYILFEKKLKNHMEMGYISGSYNLTRTAKSKDNDLIYFSIKSKKKGYPGQIQGFNRPIDRIFITNYVKLLYDFTESWQIYNEELLCPNCLSTEVDYAFYCHEMTWKSGHIHLFDMGSKGIFHECERCSFWCGQPEFEGDVILKDYKGNSLPLFSCSNCNAIFTENGGLVGDMVPYITLSKDIPILEEFDDDKNGVQSRLNKKNITLGWSEDYNV